MSNLIQWPRAQYWDKSWNPVVGCKPVSPACDNCYAEAMAKRFKMPFNPHFTSQIKPPRKGVVFCGNMTDLFGEWRICGEMAADINATFEYGVALEAQYLWLTKRLPRMVSAMEYALNDLKLPKCWFVNHYFGFTAENQAYYDWRILDLGLYPQPLNGMNIWLSAEPLLGPIDLSGFEGKTNYRRLKWVIVGCESGPNRRPCKLEWVESIIDQCRSANVPVFVKQLDLNGKCERDITKFPEHLRIRQVPWAGGVV